MTLLDSVRSRRRARPQVTAVPRRTACRGRPWPAGPRAMDPLASHRLPPPLPGRHAPRAPWPGRADHATSAPPPPLTGDLPGRTSTTNRSRVRPIALPARLFASPSLTSRPASTPPLSGYGVGNRGHICEDLKIPGACVGESLTTFLLYLFLYALIP
jgi:hypothetical protein